MNRNTRLKFLFNFPGRSISNIPQFRANWIPKSNMTDNAIAEKCVIQAPFGPVKKLVNAIEQAALTPELTEGIARFFASWDFFQNRKADYKKIPGWLKQQLLEYVERSPDEYTREVIRRIEG